MAEDPRSGERSYPNTKSRRTTSRGLSTSAFPDSDWLSMKPGEISFSLFLTAIFLLFHSFANAQTLTEKLTAENPTQLAKQARENGNIIRGAILFHQGNLNCIKCHRASAEQDRIGPDLSRIAPEVTDEFIIESILQPSKKLKEGYETFVVKTADGKTVTGIKVSEDENQIVLRDPANLDQPITILRDEIDGIRPGTLSNMPAKLADELKNRQQFLDLLRYVIDIKERGPSDNGVGGQVQIRRKLSPQLNGLMLTQQMNCASCHGDEQFTSPVPAKHAPNLKWSVEKLNPDYIQQFIADPHAVKPGTTMPELLGRLNPAMREQIAISLTHYLLSQTENDFTRQAVDGEAMHRGFELFNSVGCVACHAPRNETAVEQPLTDSQPLGDLANKYSIVGLTEFLKDPHAVRPSGYMPNMQLKHREALDIANYLLQASPEPGEATDKEWEPDATMAATGKLMFQQLRCANCHTDFQSEETPASAKIEIANSKLEAGCLSQAAGRWPNFHLKPDESESIRAWLREPVELSDKQKVEVTLTSLNCIACHAREDLGGVSVDRNPHFKTTNLNLGDQGRIPPTLTNVGAKLKTEWLRDVMVNQRSIRPYMKTRMPQYGEETIGHLFKLFEDNDQLSKPQIFAKFKDQKETREKGHVIAGNAGLNCVACHTYQFRVSDTMPAVDLTEMAQRLKKDWFYQYMLDPQTFSPNTVMPSFWPDGKAIRPDIEGLPEDQIEALWQYLIDGRQARAPRGVVIEPMEILAKDEARMLRRSYTEVGKRGIGVGYPGGMNIVFDAEQMRLATVWRGKFAEVGSIFKGQGSGNVKPLGSPIQFSKGPDLDSTAQPWVVDDGRPPEHQFKGYILDKARRPTFRYAYAGVPVEDFFEPFDDNGKTQLRRTISISPGKAVEGLRFRIAGAAKITESEGRYSIGKRVQIQMASGQTLEIVDSDEGQLLVAPIEIAAEQNEQLVIEYLIE